MLKESFIVQKRLELRDWETADVVEGTHKVVDALDCLYDNLLTDAAEDVAQMLELLADELEGRVKDGRIWDYFFKEGREPNNEG